MKKIFLLSHSLLKIALVLILLLSTSNTFAATYDWLGGTSTDVTNANNWWNSSTLANGVPGSADDVNIAVNSTYQYWILFPILQGTNNINITYLPVVTANTTWKSLTFGHGATWVAYTYGKSASISLTVNSGITLTVSGNVTQNHYASATGSSNNYIITTILGVGTLLCQGNFLVGDAATQPGHSVAEGSQVSIQITQLTITGNLVLNSNGNTTTNDICYPWFSLEKGTTTLLKQIIFGKNNSPLADAFDSYNPPLTTYPGYGKFTADKTAASVSTLELKYKQPIVPADKFYVYFTYGGNNGTVLYDDPTVENQTIYTANEPSVTPAATYINTTAPPYYNLTFSGASTKLVDANSTVGVTTQGLTVGNDWTTSGGTVNLYTNNSTVTVTDNWVNSANVTQGLGNITINNTLQNNSNTMTLGYGNLTISNIMQINGGTVAAGGGIVTVNGAFQNNGGTLACGSGSVIFKGNYTNSKTFTASTGTVYFSGASQALVDNGPTGTTFNNVTFNASGTATMGAGTGNFAVSGSGLLTMVSPAKLVAGTAAAAYLTLISTSTGSATIAAISGLSTITGNVNVQRYLTGGTLNYRGYRLLSSPVYASTVAGNNVYSINYLKNSMYLTATTTAGGFDNISAANPTLYLYRENLVPLYTTFLNSNFKGINNINSSPTYSMDDASNPTINIPAGNGYLDFFRGNRASATFAAETVPSYIPQTVTLSTSGTLNQGQVIVKNWFTPASANLSYTAASPATIIGYNLVGNPYASSIDWDQFSNTITTAAIYGPSVTKFIYVLDPVSKNYGTYQAGTGGAGTNNSTNIISSGQGFFVKATCLCAQLTFTEAAKVTTQPVGLALLMGKPAQQTADQFVRLRMLKDSVNTDEIIMRFNSSAQTAFDENEDAPYKPGSGAVSLASLSTDNVSLAINQLPLPKQQPTAISLKIKANADGIYSLNMVDIKQIPELYDIWLMDAYRKDSLDMRHNSTYNFNIYNKDTTTYGNKRFKLIIRQNPAYAYRLLNFSATKMAAGLGVQVIWKVENEQNYTHFTVERSTDNGKTFDVIGGLTGDGQGIYSLPDKDPQNGENIYRLKQEDLNDVITYSQPALVMYAASNGTLANNAISVYPNPASSGINLTIPAKLQDTGSYNITITNSFGMTVVEDKATYAQWQHNINNLLPGTYFIQVQNAKDQSLVGETRFVKL